MTLSNYMCSFIAHMCSYYSCGFLRVLFFFSKCEMKKNGDRLLAHTHTGSKARYIKDSRTLNKMRNINSFYRFGGRRGKKPIRTIVWKMKIKMFCSISSVYFSYILSELPQNFTRSEYIVHVNMLNWHCFAINRFSRRPCVYVCIRCATVLCSI